MEAQKFIELLKEKRKAAGVSQLMLAEKIGTDQARISGYETGENEPGISMILKIIEALDLQLVIEKKPKFEDLD